MNPQNKNAENGPFNDLGITHIHHLEFVTDKLEGPGSIGELFNRLGFSKTLTHKLGPLHLYQQNKINFVINGDTNPEEHGGKYFRAHGEGVSKISFAVKNLNVALERALKNKATLVNDITTKTSELGQTYQWASIKGFGDVLNELIELPENDSEFKPGYDKIVMNDKVSLASKMGPLNSPLIRIDHLTNNVPRGEMDEWVDFYQRIYGFKVTRYFDIKGKKTGLFSKVVQSGGGEVIIPINEPEKDKGKSQIQEFLDRHNGAGVQHIALTSDNIVMTLGELIDRKIKFLEVPHTYYEDLIKRLPHVTENLLDLEKNRVLADGDEEGYLLQNFSDSCIGPSFFEIIQRKNHFGFGEGNFQALFDAIERDQMQRGYL
jgi:4-hydroxyphenylpyruvate dioxygenase